MINKQDLVVSNLIRYFYAIDKIEECTFKLIELKQTVSVHSPNFTDTHGYNGTRDNKLVSYSEKKEEIEKEIENWISERDMYYNVLHLDKISKNDIMFLSLVIKDKIKYNEIARKLYFTDKSYVCRKKDKLLNLLSNYID